MILKSINLEKGEVFVRIDSLTTNESLKILCAIDMINQINFRHSIAVMMPIFAGLFGATLPFIVGSLTQQPLSINLLGGATVGGIIGFLIAFFVIRKTVREANRNSIRKLVQGTGEYDLCVDFIHQCLCDSPYLQKEFDRLGIDYPLPKRYAIKMN